MNILHELRSRFETALAEFTDDAGPLVEMVRPAQDLRFGDFQANCAMPLANRQGTNPRELAARIVERLDVSDFCQDPEVAGPGFINLRLRDDWLEAHVAQISTDKRLGVAAPPTPRKYVVDFSAPHVAKPMHVGHLRSTVIGDALCRILRFLGHDVLGDNHVGDWGTQFGMIIYGYKHFLDRKAYASDPVAELARLYRLVNEIGEYHSSEIVIAALQKWIDETREQLNDASTKQDKKAIKRLQSKLREYETDLRENKGKRLVVEQDASLKKLADDHPEITIACRAETAKLHAGDEENVRLWKQFMPQCLDALQAMYNRLDIHFDESLGESFYQPMLAGVVDDLLAKGIATESEGAICIFVEGNDAPFIIRKKDGAFTYATTDLATIRHRVEELHAEEILYVVDARQSEHFGLLFAAARKWGYTGTEFRHVSFGTILGEDRRPFKTRSGDTVGLESLLDEAVARARRIVDENDDAKTDEKGSPAPELDEAARAQVAEIVGIGGIKYADLRHNRESDYVFNWDKMLAKTGDTATYMQYAYARVCGIFRKGGIDRDDVRNSPAPIVLTAAAERSLAVQLSRFPETLDDVALDYRPNILTSYLFETAGSFSRFYDECPVLKETDDALRASRLKLCDLTARVLAEGLGLLGIRTTDRM